MTKLMSEMGDLDMGQIMSQGESVVIENTSEPFSLPLTLTLSLTLPLTLTPPQFLLLPVPLTVTPYP